MNTFPVRELFRRAKYAVAIHAHQLRKLSGYAFPVARDIVTLPARSMRVMYNKFRYSPDYEIRKLGMRGSAIMLTSLIEASKLSVAFFGAALVHKNIRADGSYLDQTDTIMIAASALYFYILACSFP